MPSSAQSISIPAISIPASGDRSFDLQGIPRRRRVARLACRGRSGAGQPPERSKRSETLACTLGWHGAPPATPVFHLRFPEVLLDPRADVWFDAPSKDRPMQNSLAFGTAPHPARHSATLACAARRTVMTGAGLSGVLLSHPRGALPCSPGKVTGGNGGKGANLIFLRHPRATSSKG
jgi:hypothetical protein